MYFMPLIADSVLPTISCTLAWIYGLAFFKLVPKINMRRTLFLDLEFAVSLLVTFSLLITVLFLRVAVLLVGITGGTPAAFLVASPCVYLGSGAVALEGSVKIT